MKIKNLIKKKKEKEIGQKEIEKVCLFKKF